MFVSGDTTERVELMSNRTTEATLMGTNTTTGQLEGILTRLLAGVDIRVCIKYENS